MNTGIVEKVKASITGRLAMTDAEAQAIVDYIGRAGEGIHLEIGCLYGATAAVAALAKQEWVCNGKVITIDPMTGGWWNAGTPDPATQISPSHKIVVDNLTRLGVLDKVEIVQDYSYNVIPTMDIRPATALIDGDHSRLGCLVDWFMLSPIVQRYILVHDYDPVHQGVIDTITRNIYHDERWKLIDMVEHMAVFERV